MATASWFDTIKQQGGDWLDTGLKVYQSYTEKQEQEKFNNQAASQQQVLNAPQSGYNQSAVVGDAAAQAANMSVIKVGGMVLNPLYVAAGAAVLMAGFVMLKR